MKPEDIPSCPLFEGIPLREIPNELRRLQAVRRRYEAGHTLLEIGRASCRERV